MGRLPLVDGPGVPRLNVFRALGNHEGVLKAVLGLGTAAYWGGSLSPRVREVAYLAASAANTCHY